MLDALRADSPNPMSCLRRYPETFRKALETGNRLCLCSFMAAESDRRPKAVTKKVQAFADVNVAWLSKVLSASGLVGSGESDLRARVIFAAVAGARHGQEPLGHLVLRRTDQELLRGRAHTALGATVSPWRVPAKRYPAALLSLLCP